MELNYSVNLDTLDEETKRKVESGEITEEELIKNWKEEQDKKLGEIESKAAKSAELADNYKKRAEKAEDDLKKGKKGPETQPTNLSNADMMVLIRENVHEDDLQEVTDFAKLKGISISEALKSTVLKTILDDKNEKRKTAEATNTGNANQGATTPSGNELLEKARKTGEMPDSDAGLKDLVNARINGKKKK